MSETITPRAPRAAVTSATLRRLSEGSELCSWTSRRGGPFLPRLRRRSAH
jgi:hypothetical protein